jgi:hypothetical protein
MADFLPDSTRAGRMFQLLGLCSLVLLVAIVVLFPSRSSPQQPEAVGDLVLFIVVGCYATTCLLIGRALNRRGSRAKLPGIILAVVSLPLVPFGTLLGGAALIYLLRSRNERAEI